MTLTPPGKLSRLPKKIDNVTNSPQPSFSRLAALFVLLVLLVAITAASFAAAQTLQDLQKLRERSERPEDTQQAIRNEQAKPSQEHDETLQAPESTTPTTDVLSRIIDLLIVLLAVAAVVWAWLYYERLRKGKTAQKQKAKEAERAELAEQYSVAEEIIPFAAKLRKQGYTDKEILAILVNQGWRKNVVRDVLAHLDEEQGTQPPPPGPT
ncbi:hypothetical protein D6783_04205 [Candidatus Woesearchaeota archaeon]|nr:MAG: hypothetical protein D6783_04205 [Candidatus Woesearchaeota archaeon]